MGDAWLAVIITTIQGCCTSWSAVLRRLDMPADMLKIWGEKLMQELCVYLNAQSSHVACWHAYILKPLPASLRAVAATNFMLERSLHLAFDLT